jgi:1-acyl-sn-glycerol-3-phosphate acyltransferase
MIKPRLLPSLWTAFLVVVTTAKTCIQCIFMTRVTRNKAYTLSHARANWAPNMFWVANSTLEVIDEGHVDYTKPHIFVMNHQSHMDIPAAFMSIPSNMGFVAKKELERVPLFGRVMREAGMIFVDRSDPARAIASLKAGGALIRSGVNIFAFPEGTRTTSGLIRNFKKGVFMLALEARVPIVPMSVHGAREVLPVGSFDPQGNVIKVKVGKPIPLDGYSVETRDDLIAAVRESVIQLNLDLGGQGGEA